MSKITAPNSNYQISERNDMKKVMYSPELKKMIIGVPSDLDTETNDAKLIFDTNIYSIDIPQYYGKLFQFSTDKRTTIEKAVDFLIETNKYKIHMGKNFEAVLNYSYNREKRYLANIVKRLFDIHTEADSTAKIATIEKMFKTTNFRKETALLSGYICAYNLISPSFAEKGEGYIYIINTNLTSEEIESIDNVFKEHLHKIYSSALNDLYTVNSKKGLKFNVDELYDIEYCLDDLLNLKGKYEKWEIKTMYKNIHFSTNYSDMISAMMTD